MNETRHLQIRHWDYWWSAHGFAAPAESAEFSITKDETGKNFYFHLDLDTIPALKRLCVPGEFLEEDDPSYPIFLQKAEALCRGELDFFVGWLYYRYYAPDISVCNQFQERGNDIFQVKSLPQSPYYAVIFIREEQALSLERLLQWMDRLSWPLFRQKFTWKVAQVPTREASWKSYQEERRHG